MRHAIGGVLGVADGGAARRLLDNIDELPTRATRLIFNTLSQPDDGGPEPFRGGRHAGSAKRAGSDPKPARLRRRSGKGGISTSRMKPVIERKFRLRCERADDIYGITGVMQSAGKESTACSIVLAGLTNRNANVYYELGIAHTLGKPVVMMSQDINDVPSSPAHDR